MYNFHAVYCCDFFTYFLIQIFTMYNTTIYNQETFENIPYGKYFEFFPCNNWSLHHYVSMVTDNYEHAEKKEAHRAFYKVLHDINNDLCMLQKVCDVAQNLIKSGKVSVFRITNLV